MSMRSWPSPPPLTCANPAICNDADNRTPTPVSTGFPAAITFFRWAAAPTRCLGITLTELVKSAESVDQFLQELLPDCLEAVGNYMNERVKFLVERSGFSSRRSWCGKG